MLRRLLLSATALLVLGALALGWSFLPSDLALDAPHPGPLPPASPPAGMSLSVIETGTMESRALFAFRGGAWSDRRLFSMYPLLIRHPRGDLLIDAGFGGAVDAHVARTPRVAQALSRHTAGVPAGEQLNAHGIDPATLAGVLPTHVHWDHVSGLDALGGAPVWLNADEHEWIPRGGDGSDLMRHLAPQPLRVYEFGAQPYLGFERSFDIWGDGSVVVVPAPGHTPGSVIVFVALPSGRRFALLGDLVWQREGIERPAERPWLARRMLREDDAGVREQLARIVAIHRAHPELTLLPAHDARAYDGLPRFPDALR